MCSHNAPRPSHCLTLSFHLSSATGGGAGRNAKRRGGCRLLDGSRFHEFKPLYGTTLITGFGRLYGQQVPPALQRGRDEITITARRAHASILGRLWGGGKCPTTMQHLAPRRSPERSKKAI